MISEKVFLKMLKSFTSAEMKFPIRFSDDNGKLLNEKFNFWYDQLKNVIREDLPNEIVKKIIIEETEFPRISKIYWWATRLDCEIADPQKMEMVRKQQQKDGIEEQKRNKAVEKKTASEVFGMFSGKEPKRKSIVAEVSCPRCKRKREEWEECLCFRIEREKKKIKEYMEQFENGIC